MRLQQVEKGKVVFLGHMSKNVVVLLAFFGLGPPPPLGVNIYKFVFFLYFLVLLPDSSVFGTRICIGEGLDCPPGGAPIRFEANQSKWPRK